MYTQSGYLKYATMLRVRSKRSPLLDGSRTQSAHAAGCGATTDFDLRLWVTQRFVATAKSQRSHGHQDNGALVRQQTPGDFASENPRPPILGCCAAE